MTKAGSVGCQDSEEQGDQQRSSQRGDLAEPQGEQAGGAGDRESASAGATTRMW